MATECGIDTLVRCTRDSEAKTILKAGTFCSLNEAIQKFREKETTTTPAKTSPIYYGGVSGGNYSRGCGNFRGNRGRGSMNARRTMDPLHAKIGQ